MPFDRFVDCYIDENYLRLLKTGTARNDLLKKMWENIFEEYSIKSNSVTYKRTCDLLGKIGELLCKLFIVYQALSVLKYGYNDFFIKQLKNLGYNYSFDKNNRETYAKDLENVYVKNKSFEIDLKRAEKEYEQLTKENEKQRKITREDFNNELLTFSQWIGGGLIHSNSITVEEYLTIKNNYSNYIRDLKIKNGK